MVYLKQFFLPSANTECNDVLYETRTWINTYYPYKIFPEKGLRSVEFDGITMLYGGNGSGKSTLINLIARKTGASRYTEFNAAPLFDQFAEKCGVEYSKYPKASLVLTSDDVFDYVLNARNVNENISDKRDEIAERYSELYAAAEKDPGLKNLRSLDEYDRWKEVREILSPKRTQSQYIRKRIGGDLSLCSNGETALRYFTDRIDGDSLYLLDEPENSLSIEYQLRLAEYIENMVRYTKSQFIIATHSPILLSMQGARVYNLDGAPAKVCHWTDLPNVRLFYNFFNSHRDEFEK